MIYIIIMIVAIWVICGVFTYGLSFAYVQKEFSTIAERDYKKDKRYALYLGLLGIFSLIVVLFTNGIKHGLKFK